MLRPLAPLGVGRFRPARPQAARVREGRRRRRPRHPARRRSSRRIRCCAGCIWNTRSTSCATPICSASAARRCSSSARRAPTTLFNTNPLPGGHGLDDLAIEGEPDHRLLAFLHVAEKAAAGRFAIYRDVVDDDPSTRAIFEEILRDEVFHMNYTYTQLARIWPERLPAAGVAGAREPPVEAIPAAGGGRGGRRSATSMLTVMYFVVLAPFAWLAKRAAAPRAGRLDADRPRAQRVRRRASTEMKILGISAHYHDSAAALVVDGVPVCAVQEERLSRHKNDAAFPARRDRMVPGARRLEPADLDAVVFYERSMLKFDRILTSALRAFPRSWRSFPDAMKNSLGEKVWVRGIISSHLGVPRSKILFTGHHHSHAAAAFLTAPTERAAILTADGVGEWATLTVGHGERRPGGAAGITLAARDPISPFARHAVLDVHRVSRLRGERGRVQGDGPRRLRPSDA